MIEIDPLFIRSKRNLNNPPLGVSNFARQNSIPQMGNSHFNDLLSWEKLVDLVLLNWNKAVPGHGEKDCKRKVVVPVNPYCENGLPLFRCTTAILDPKMPIRARIIKRAGQDQENFFVQTYAPAKEFYQMGFQTEPANFVNIVCYSADALEENGGERSTECDWEIVTILASPVEKEPMSPLTMARNQLELPGGTYAEYTWRDYAEAILFKQCRIRIVDDSGA